ncbi:hypothetical protein F3Y22_tig00010141pilonHSYRG00002 [Hibiscus syriacus]|uniref:Secreted protein n=1 Tax=Hibiscus syriacus TaxID=106335 RepID=A0A6A3C7Z4_HIBSY|nr:hypothetical protein F3Y22_tig00010141pilonHSYRG00002 [Hibiscus syriacus]
MGLLALCCPACVCLICMILVVDNVAATVGWLNGFGAFQNRIHSVTPGDFCDPIYSSCGRPFFAAAPF